MRRMMSPSAPWPTSTPISTHTPMRGVTELQRRDRRHERISTHTPHAGSDQYRLFHDLFVYEFQPTLPMRGVTLKVLFNMWDHTFQPTLPMRGVTPEPSCAQMPILFQPTLPMRGVTELAGELKSVKRFQPTLPMRGVTTVEVYATRLKSGFQPTLPMRGVTSLRRMPSQGANFNPHSPCGE